MDPVGRYRIAGEIGRGATGVVYKALDPAIGRTVAIKTIHLTDLTDADARQREGERLLHEARAAGTLSHPNIVTVFDVIQQADFAYIVMELVPGPSLAELLREKRVPESRELLILLRQVAEALDYAHRKGIIHRDVKPANILIAGTAKITDFGVAKTLSHEITQSGDVTGTPSYMSPEQIEGKTLDGRADQFSLAVVVYELLGGRKPFTADTLPALLHGICREDAPSILSANPALGETVAKVMARALAKNAEDRFDSASDFIGALAIGLLQTPARQAENQTRGVGATAVAQATRGRETIAPLSGSTAPFHDSEPPQKPSNKKLTTIVFLCFAVAAAIVFLIRLNSGTPVAVEVVKQVAPPPVSPQPNDSAARSGTLPQAPQERKAPPQKADAPSPEPVANSASESLPPKPESINPQPATVPAEPRTADIDLLSEPAGARILVDGRADAACNAPCTMSIATGRHTLTAQLNGYSVAHRIFNLPDESRLYIPLSQSNGVLVITTIPAGSTVVVDGRMFGQTPATLHLSSGVHRILLSNGASKHEETVNIEAESFQSRSVHW